LRYSSDDGSLKYDQPLGQWITTLTGAAKTLGRDPNPGRQLQGWVKNAGFKNVVHKLFKIPIGLWAKDPKLKELGLWNYMQINSGLEGLTLRLYTNVLKWKVEEIMVLLAQVRRDLRNPRIHGYLNL
jgi:hypothetical protein